jgi:hypothetical protein
LGFCDTLLRGDDGLECGENKCAATLLRHPPAREWRS